jgi:V-type H+-transporting ATPase subunit a
MSLGICMKAFNALYFKNKLDFYFEFVPQIILMMVLFGYMDMLIIVKWLTDYSGREHEAPSVITTMIEMALNGGATAEGFAPILGGA